MPKKTGKGAGAAGAAPRDLDILREMVELLDSSSALTLSYQRGDATYEVSRAGHAGHAGVPMAPMAPLPPAPAAAPAAPAAAAPAVALKEVKSPMVGTFYGAPEPGAAPYAKVGTRVKAGQVVCIIEAMKIMNEIEAEVSGVVKEVCVDDASPVEFGQVLFRVDPNG
ncbi:MAG TPA: acetyl-CoA carboxylase biotin carboxyl carrier protein [Gemmatimonadales bacterium]|nr:acetyl-CoA carboxylase biotin carboxyl carrier protein [Gemmatimonadales bacterium]